MKTLSDFPGWEIVERQKKKDIFWAIVEIIFGVNYLVNFSVVETFWDAAPEWLIIVDHIFGAVIFFASAGKRIANTRTQMIRYDENNLYYVKNDKIIATPWRNVKGIRGDVSGDTERFGIDIALANGKNRVLIAAGPGKDNSTVNMDDINKIRGYANG